VDDVRHLPPDVSYSFNESFDLAIGYHTRSTLTAPISTRSGQVIGVLQLINRKTDAAARVFRRRLRMPWSGRSGRARCG